MTKARAHVEVNGAALDLSTVPDAERLLDTVRWRLGLKGTKEGCRTGSCGACTVLVDGRSTLSCLTLTHELDGASVRTIESVEDSPLGKRVVGAFETEGAAQCGYCIPGFVMAVTGLLGERPKTSETAELLEDLEGNLCRCTGYAAIVRAVERARKGST